MYDRYGRKIKKHPSSNVNRYNPNKPKKQKRHLTPYEELLIREVYNTSLPRIGINSNYDVIPHDSRGVIHIIEGTYPREGKRVNSLGIVESYTANVKYKLDQFRSYILDYIAEYRGFATVQNGNTYPYFGRTKPISNEERNVIKEAFISKNPAEYSVSLAVVPYASIRGYGEIYIPDDCKSAKEYEEYIVTYLRRDKTNEEAKNTNRQQSMHSYIREIQTGDRGL